MLGSGEEPDPNIYYRTTKNRSKRQRLLRCGDPAEIRTPDTLLKRQVLCQLSYWVKYSIETSSAKSKPSEAGSIWKRGTAKRVRFDF